jgi:hypothetical protein
LRERRDAGRVLVAGPGVDQWPSAQPSTPRSCRRTTTRRTDRGWGFIAFGAENQQKPPHLNLITSDFEAEAARLLALGAVKVKETCQNGARWLTFFDVEGNEFDLIAG